MSSPSALARELSTIVSPDAVVGPDDARYDKLRRVWNAMIDRRPAAIVQPADSAQVADVVKLASRNGLALAVRCGGHSFPGFSTCDAGVVLDLSRMNAVTVDAPTRTATLGGGALLGDLDKASAVIGMVTPAGLVSHTGAGGLTLGGGMGWTSRRLGLTIDSLISAELVTASGDIVEASEASLPDLFWGLRGGGGNFGVVTRFTFRLHPLGEVTVGVWDYPENRLERVLEEFSIRASQAPRSLTTQMGITSSGLRVTAFHSGEDGKGAQSVAPFGDLAGPGIGGLTGMDYVTLQSRSDDVLRWGRRYYGRGGFLASLEEQTIVAASELARSAPSKDSEVYMIQLGGAVSDVDEAATAYSGRGAQFYWIVQPIWDNPDDDEKCLSWGREGGKRLASLSQAGNYLNEQGEVGRDVTLQAYGREKYERLERLKSQYDPANLFRLNQNIAPAVESAA